MVRWGQRGHFVAIDRIGTEKVLHLLSHLWQSLVKYMYLYLVMDELRETHQKKLIRNMHLWTLNLLLKKKIGKFNIFIQNSCEIVLSLKWSLFYITAYPWPFQYWPLLVRTGPSTHEPVYRTCCMAHNSFVSSVGHTERAHHMSYPCPPANESENLLINQLFFIDITCICNSW